MKEKHYSTKTEFVREAIREKMNHLEKMEALAHLDRLYGISKRRTTDADLHRAREKVFDDLEKEFHGVEKEVHVLEKVRKNGKESTKKALTLEEKNIFFKKVKAMRGSSPHKSTDEGLHKTREKLAKVHSLGQHFEKANS